MQNQHLEKTLRPYINSCFLFLLVFLVNIFIAEISAAQNIIKIDNLSFSCNNCEVQETENSCNLLLKAEAISFPCNQALDYFFSILKITDTNNQYPSVLELKNYILLPSQNKNLRTGALNILLKREDGRRLFLENINDFINQAAEFFSEVIPFNYQYQDVWQAVWNSANFQDSKMDAAVRSKIFAYLDIPTKELFKDILYLSLLDKTLVTQLEIIEIYKANSQGKKPEIVEQLALLKNFLEDCASINSILSNEKCIESTLLGTNINSLTLISKLKFNFVLAEIKRSFAFKPEDIINLLSKTNYYLIRTPDSHQLLYQSLETLEKNNFCEAKKIYYQYQSLLNEYKKYDENIKGILNTLSNTQCNLVEETLEKRRKRLFYALGIFIVMLIAIFITKKKLLILKNKELNQLLNYFNLSVRDQEKLSEAYYSLAKKYHPDASTGSEELFKELNEKHQRLKELL